MCIVCRRLYIRRYVVIFLLSRSAPSPFDVILVALTAPMDEENHAMIQARQAQQSRAYNAVRDPYLQPIGSLIYKTPTSRSVSAVRSRVSRRAHPIYVARDIHAESKSHNRYIYINYTSLQNSSPRFFPRASYVNSTLDSWTRPRLIYSCRVILCIA